MVLDFLSSNNNGLPAVRRPLFEVKVAGGGGSPASGGLASAVGGALGVELGSGGSEPWKQHLISIYLELGLAPAVDLAEIHLATGRQAPRVAVGDRGSIALGYEDDLLQPVFAGQIESVSRSIHGSDRLTASNGGANLAKLRLNQSYEQQKAGDIVKDLASRAEVEAGEVADGIDLPFYAIDDRQTAYQHIAALARKSGCLAYFTPAGKLNFVPPESGEAVQSFTYGSDILSLHIRETRPTIGKVTTVGEGAASSQGKTAWSWLLKDPSSVQGSAGTEGAERLIGDPSLRSQDAAQQAAASIASAASRGGIRGRLLVPGATAVVVGRAIAITKAPQSQLNGLFLVGRLCHRFDKYQGFTTLMELSQAGAGSGAGSFGDLLGQI